MINFNCKLLLKCTVIMLFVFCSGCSKEQQNITVQTSHLAPSGAIYSAGVIDKPSVMMTMNNLFSSNPDAKTHTPLETISFSSLGRGVAYIEDLNGRQRVVHNGKPGNYYSEISHLMISPDGTRVSYTRKLGDKLQQISDNVGGKLYNLIFSAAYSPDSRHVACLAVSIDSMSHILLDGKSIEESPSAVSSDMYFSNDSSKLLYHVRPVAQVEGHPARVVIYDIKTGRKVIKECLDTHIVVNRKTERVAMAVMDGAGQRVIDFRISAPDDVHTSGLYDEIAKFSIAIEEDIVSFTGVRGGKSFLVLKGKEEHLPDDLVVFDTPVIRPDLKGVGVILATTERHNRRFTFHQVMYGAKTKQKQYDHIKELVYSKTDSSSAYVAKENDKHFVVLNGKEGPKFDNVVTPMFSPDGSKLVYRVRNEGKRFVVVADVSGTEHRRHPEYEIAFPTVFTEDGKSVAYGVKDGNKLMWKVEKL